MPGAIFYRGPSEFDGQPIVGIAVWSSRNRKTGDLLQTYILREDIDPITANKYGEDESICGTCSLKGEPTTDPKRKLAKRRKCYVTLMRGPLMAYKAMLRGNYPDACTTAGRRALGAGRKVRIGTYGDGAAIPTYVWDEMLHFALGHTAYTHATVNPDPRYYMVSVESLTQAKAAWSRGERTFRIIPIGAKPEKNEVMCPASRGVQCEDCMLCGGTSVRAKSVAIEVHGVGKTYFI